MWWSKWTFPHHWLKFPIFRWFFGRASLQVAGTQNMREVFPPEKKNLEDKAIKYIRSFVNFDETWRELILAMIHFLFTVVAKKRWTSRNADWTYLIMKIRQMRANTKNERTNEGIKIVKNIRESKKKLEKNDNNARKEAR